MPLQLSKVLPDIRPNTGLAPLITMTFPATEAHVRQVVCETIEKLKTFEFTQDFRVTVEIVLAEILNNVAEHGYPCEIDGDVQLSIMVLPNGIQVETRDKGVQMPGLRLPRPPEPDLDVGRENLPEGQFGLFMIHELCQNLTYQRIENENCLSLFIAR